MSTELTEAVSAMLQESWGDIVTPEMRFDPRDGDYGEWEVGWPGLQFYTNRRDMADGRFIPVYENEMHLRSIRMSCRLMAERVPTAKAIISGLTDYTISKGFDWKVEHPSERIRSICESVLKSFNEVSEWQETLERESFMRELIDGEFLGELIAEGPDVMLEPMDPEWLTEPANPRPLEDWLGVDFDACWCFGVMKKRNRTRALSYHIVRNDSGTDWDVLQPSDCIHWKRNVPKFAARGFGDFYIATRYLARADKVAINTAVGAATQAAIAYIVEHAPGQTRSQVQAIVDSLRNTRQVATQSGTYTRHNIAAGTRIDLGAGQKFHAGLLGSNQSSIYIDVMEAILRLLGTIWKLPEHMITGFAGNNNLASSLVAESPFVQGRFADQAVRKSRKRTLLLKVLKKFFESPWARGRGYSWDAVRQGLDVSVTEPVIITRDPVALTTALEKQIALGLTSKRTASQELGRDYETEQANIADEGGSGESAGQSEKPAGGSGELASMSRRQQQNVRKAIRDVLGELGTGAITPDHATAMLSALGLSAPTVTSLIGTQQEQGKITEQVDAAVKALRFDSVRSGCEEGLKTLDSAPKTPDELLLAVKRCWTDYP